MLPKLAYFYNQNLSISLLLCR